MTKEELKHEAEEYLENNYCRKTVCTCDEIKECKEGIRIRCMAFEHGKQLIVDFAEPREKQIQIDAEQIRALQKQNGELTDKVNELEALNEKMKCCETCRYYDYHEIGTGNKDCILWYRDKVFCEHKNMWELGR